MKKSKSLVFAVFLAFIFTCATGLQKTSFYDAFKGSDHQAIENCISSLSAEKESNKKNAYLGALKMKMADFKTVPKKKIEIFKEGHQLFESALTSNPSNIEYRFIRLAIQENCPKILKYNTNIDEDKELVIKNYNKLDPSLRAFILDYSENSSLLSKEELQ